MKKANYFLPKKKNQQIQPRLFSFTLFLSSEPYEDRPLSNINAKGVNECPVVTPVAEILLKSSSGLQYLWRPRLQLAASLSTPD